MVRAVGKAASGDGTVDDVEGDRFLYILCIFRGMRPDPKVHAICARDKWREIDGHVHGVRARTATDEWNALRLRLYDRNRIAVADLRSD